MKIQTNWIVFSGVTSSGKTTIANLLIRYGYKVPTEVARVYINELQTQMTPEHLSAFVQTYEFQYEIARRGLLCQQELDPSDIVIIDCGLMGSFVYFQLRGHTEQFNTKGDDKPLQEHLENNRYRGVFLFEKLPCDDDPCRFSTAENLRDQAHALIKEVNVKQGYTSIKVPIGSVEERLQFVLGAIIDMLPTVMTDCGLKQPSGSDRFYMKDKNSSLSMDTSKTRMIRNGLKLYSGSYLSLFFSMERIVLMKNIMMELSMLYP